MKYFIAFLLLVSLAVSSRAQITLEHLYPPVNNPGNSIYDNISLVEVDSGLWKYISFNGRDTIFLYNLNHSLDHSIKLPAGMDTLWDLRISFFSKRLFDLDDKYDYMLAPQYGLSSLRVYKEDGTVVFGCEDCFFQKLVNTPEGVKMLIGYGYEGQTAVFSLPGKLPTGGSARSSVNSPSIINSNSLPTSAYPNPSNGQMRISYKLPLGESTGELVILSTDGVEVKRYKVGYGFNDILVEKSDLPSGSYFYKLVTTKGESEMKRLVVLK